MHNTVFCSYTKKFRKALENSGNYDALPTNPKKEFDYIPQDLIIASLPSYGFHRP